MQGLHRPPPPPADISEVGVSAPLGLNSLSTKKFKNCWLKFAAVKTALALIWLGMKQLNNDNKNSKPMEQQFQNCKK